MRKHHFLYAHLLDQRHATRAGLGEVIVHTIHIDGGAFEIDTLANSSINCVRLSVQSTKQTRPIDRVSLMVVRCLAENFVTSSDGST